MTSLSRMVLLFGAGVALVGAGPSPGTRVSVEIGELEGVSAGGVLAFKGIPFAAPPVGPLRWRAPQPAIGWTGVRQASRYGHDCMQLPFPSDAAPLGTPPAEDCLYANVWRPAAAAAKLPVLVWIYGGGFVNGGASPPTYSGAELARQGIIVVSFNYRVGRFGTFAHPALTKANADHGLLGNYGYMDQIAALKWVRRNIAAFGGDPANVTIVGESAGGMSVHTLVTSPLGRGLFARAVVQSGGDGTGLGPPATLASVEAIGVTFAKAKGIAEDDPQALDKLRALSADQVTDGLNLAAMFRPGPRTFAATIAGQGVPTYYYRFSYVADSARAPATKGAGHASDIPYFFDTVAIKYGDRTSAADRMAGRLASGYLVNFVRTGDPNGPGLPKWQPYSRASEAMLDLSAQATAVPERDPWAADLDAAATKPPAN